MTKKKKKKSQGGSAVAVADAAAIGEAASSIKLGEKDATARAADDALRNTVKASKGVSKAAVKKAQQSSTAAALSSNNVSSSDKAKKTKKEKKEKKSQLDGIRKMASSGSSFSFE